MITVTVKVRRVTPPMKEAAPIRSNQDRKAKLKVTNHDNSDSQSVTHDSTHEGSGTNQSEGTRIHPFPVGVFIDGETKHGSSSRKTVGAKNNRRQKSKVKSHIP